MRHKKAPTPPKKLEPRIPIEDLKKVVAAIRARSEGGNSQERNESRKSRTRGDTLAEPLSRLSSRCTGE